MKKIKKTKQKTKQKTKNKPEDFYLSSALDIRV